MKWAGYYGEYDDYGNAEARLSGDITRNELALSRVEDNLDGLSENITDVRGRVTSTQSDLDSLVNRQADSYYHPSHRDHRG